MHTKLHRGEPVRRHLVEGRDETAASRRHTATTINPDGLQLCNRIGLVGRVEHQSCPLAGEPHTGLIDDAAVSPLPLKESWDATAA
jgi:hypothetical protein